MIPETQHQPFQWTFQKTVWGTLVLVFVFVGFWLLYRFYEVVFVLLIAIVIGTVIRPVVGWLHRRGLSRMSGVIVVYLGLLTLMIGFLLLIFPLIFVQGATISALMPKYYQGLREWLVNSPNEIIMRLGWFMPAAMSEFTPAPQTGSEMMASAGQALGYLSMVTQAALTGIVTMALAFYWTLDGPRTIRSILMLVPQEQRTGINVLIADMETKVGQYVVGQSILCLVIGTMALVAYLLIGLPNALVLALIAGVLEAVPMLGPLLGAVPAAMVALSLGPDRLIWVIVATVIIQQLENSLLVPRVMSKAVGVNPFVSMLAFFAFSTLLGMAGALMAIPMAAILQLLLNRFVFYPAAMDAEISTGRDYTSRLRYEAQDLAQDLRKQARIKKGGSDQATDKINQVLEEIETITIELDALLASRQGLIGLPEDTAQVEHSHPMKAQ